MRHEEYEEILRDQGLVVHFSVVHRKFSNSLELPMRYERYFLVWEARRPYRILGVSRWPVLFGDERARPWSVEEDLGWDEGLRELERHGRREVSMGAVGGEEDIEETQANEIDSDGAGDDMGHRSNFFTYTPSIAWAWRGKSNGEDEEVHRRRGHEYLGTGYLGDEIVVGIGIDDVAQGFVRVRAEDVLRCIKVCDVVAVATEGFV